MGGKRGSRGEELAVLGGRQHGVVALRQLLELGFSRREVERMVEAARLHRLFRAVYAIGHRAVTREARYMGAVLACGSDAVLSHWAAAAHWGLLGAREAADIDISIVGHRRGQRGIRPHRVESIERTVRDRIPVTTVPRTLLDLAPVGSWKQLRRATNQAERRGWLTERAVDDLAERHRHRKGIKAFVAVTAAVTAGTHRTRSDLEADFLALLKRTGIERPVANGEVEGYEVDFHWPGAKLIVELDSYEYHRTPTQFDEDRRRDAALKLKGYTVIRVSDAWLNADPAGVAATIRQLLTI